VVYLTKITGFRRNKTEPVRRLCWILLSQVSC